MRSKVNRIWHSAYLIWIIMSIIYSWYVFISNPASSGYLPTFILFTVISIALTYFIQSVKIKYFITGICTGILTVSFFFGTHIFPILIIFIISRLIVMLLVLLKNILRQKHCESILDYVMIILITVFMLEIILDITEYVFDIDILKDKKELTVLSPGNRINGETLNRFGYLGNEPDVESNRKKWLFIGDSFGFGSVDYDSNFIKIAQDCFNITSVNVSWPGFSPRDYLGQLDRFIDMNNFDRIFIIIFTGNDIIEMKEGNKVNHNRWHYSKSNIYHLIRNTALLLRYKAFMENNMHFSERNYIELETRRTIGNINTTADMWLDFRSVVQSIVKRAERDSLPVNFIVIPDEYTVNKNLQSKITENTDSNELDFMYAHRRTISMLEDINADFIDMHPILDSLNSSGQQVYIRNNTHINETGNIAIVNAMEKHLFH